MPTDSPPLASRPDRFDFHSHTYLTDGDASATDMWRHADLLGHRALAVTDHLSVEDPAPMLQRLHQEARAWEGEALVTLVGVEITLAPPRRIAEVAHAARRAGAEIVIVHGETLAEPVEPGTNRAAISCPEVDLLAHPGLLTDDDAALAHDHGTFLELSGRRGHSLANGHVAITAIEADVDLVVDSDAHRPDELLSYEQARRIAAGAGVKVAGVERALREAPRRLLKRCGKG